MDKDSTEAGLLATIANEEGFETVDRLVEHCHLDSVVPGICRVCRTVKSTCEPDLQKGWCEECDGTHVASVLVLAGLC